jgi:hypothetical protein
MGNYFLGLGRGQVGTITNPTIGTVTQGTDIEVRIDDSKGSSKEDVVLALKNITNYILSNGVPAGVSNINVDIPVL